MLRQTIVTISTTGSNQPVAPAVGGMRCSAEYTTQHKQRPASAADVIRPNSATDMIRPASAAETNNIADVAMANDVSSPTKAGKVTSKMLVIINLCVGRYAESIKGLSRFKAFTYLGHVICIFCGCCLLMTYRGQLLSDCKRCLSHLLYKTSFLNVVGLTKILSMYEYTCRYICAKYPAFGQAYFSL